MSLETLQNVLLSELPSSDLARITPHLEFIDLVAGEVLHEAGTALSHVVFPLTAIVSLLFVLENGATSETAMVGREGVVGVSLFMGGETTPSRAEVQSPGRGVRLRTARIREEFDRGGPVMHVLLRYTQALMTQMAQTAVCNRHHAIGKQLCRWLLQCLDRLDGNDIAVTHEQIAHMLGVRREGITEAAARLQALGLISTRRGHMTVPDRDALEGHTCECYRVVKSEYERLLPRCANA